MDIKYDNFPDSEVMPERTKDLSPDGTEWSNLGVSIYEGITNSLSDRANFDTLLDYYNDLYEMNTGPNNTPWPNAPSIAVPLVRTQLEAVVSRLVSAVFVPRLFVVNGNTAKASSTQHEVERYYNADFRKRHLLENFITALHLSARDGVGIMENVWTRKEVKRKVLVYTDKIMLIHKGIRCLFVSMIVKRLMRMIQRVLALKNQPMSSSPIHLNL